MKDGKPRRTRTSLRGRLPETDRQQHQTLAAVAQLVAHGVIDQPTIDDYGDVSLYEYILKENGGTIVWNITLALHLAAQHPPDMTEVEPEQLAHVALTYDYDEATVRRADPTQPGLCGLFLWHGSSTVSRAGLTGIIIDGIHRAVQAHRLGQPFFVNRLSLEDNRASIINAPPGVIP